MEKSQNTSSKEDYSGSPDPKLMYNISSLSKLTSTLEEQMNILNTQVIGTS